MSRTIGKNFSSYLPAIASGALVALSFPDAGLSVLAWFAFVPLLYSLWQQGPARSFRYGFVFGLVSFVGSLYWIYHSIYHYGGVSLAASASTVLLLSAYLALFPAVFALLLSAGLGRTRLPVLFIAPVLWVALEFLRSYALTGFPWASIGYSQYRFLTLIQVADITGIYGISFLVLAVNGAMADILLIRKRLNEMPLFPLSYTIAGLAALLLVLLFSLGYGTFRLHEQRPGTPVSVCIIQGNIEQDRKWVPAYQHEVLDTYESLSRDALTRSPDLIVWPETAVPFYFGYDTRLTERLLTFQRGLGTYLLFGSVLVKDRNAERPELSNSAVLLDPEGKKIFTYDKIHLVPFGEYVPLRRVLFFVDALVAGIGDYIPGREYVRAETPFGTFATLICYEVIFPGLVRKFFVKGGDFIVTITNDAWFGRTPGPSQHFSMSVFRAIENRKPVIRAANTGISGYIDSNGRIQRMTGLFSREIVTDRITTDRTLTAYTRFGDLFSYLCIVAAIVLAVNIFSRR